MMMMSVRLSDFGCPGCTCIECIRGGGSRMYELPSIHVLVQPYEAAALPYPGHPFWLKLISSYGQINLVG
jgi:hypothetical protein